MEQHNQVSFLLMYVVTGIHRINYWCVSFQHSLPLHITQGSICKVSLSPLPRLSVTEVSLMMPKSSDNTKKRYSLHWRSLRRIMWTWLGVTYPMSEYLELLLFEMDTTTNPTLQYYRVWVVTFSTVTPLMLFCWIVKMYKIFSLNIFHSLQTWLAQPFREQENYLELQKGEAGVPDQIGLEKDKCFTLFFMAMKGYSMWINTHTFLLVSFWVSEVLFPFLKKFNIWVLLSLAS